MEPDLSGKPKQPSLKARHKIEYDALVNAIHRCHNASHRAYYNYGARGIHVCDEWRTLSQRGFAKFLEHIGPKPHPHLTLDRLDNDKGYEPGNVGWRTRSEQALNRRPAYKGQTYTIGGLTLTVCEWGKHLDLEISEPTLRRRLQKCGGDLSKVSAPVRKYNYTKAPGRPRKDGPRG